ncbi:DUF6894 family protein [Bradyrhizobium sp. CCBAU 45389]|uniref:DUF6894 family protein n=1 Tax=Bradyrhizobium sp. CCBAU 45389 TaxID=858429 RepID=UPI002306A3E0|nr:hypothetical protein [Bradyrhizobium sp. CCBAU 45389]MDA9405236.1 hypothetical protein [Bradyrhizobium sp. CCBAU 45389]
MARYYFDLRDKDGLVVDEEGSEIADMEGVEREASRAMADAARESFQRPTKPGEASIEIRDDFGPVMRVQFTVQIERLRRQ